MIYLDDMNTKPCYLNVLFVITSMLGINISILSKNMSDFLLKMHLKDLDCLYKREYDFYFV